MRRRAATLTVAAALLAAGLAAALGAGDTVSAYTDTSSASGGTFSAIADWTAPTAASAVVGKAAGGDTGYVRANSGFYVYANVTDSGNPAAGVASVTGAVGNLSYTTPAALSAGSWTAGGVAYNRRSALLTTKSFLANAATTFSLTSTDAVTPANTETGSFPAVGDSVVPTATGITAANKTGGVAGRPELGDTVTYTSSEPLDPDSIYDGWSGATVDIQAAIYENYGQDYLVVGPTTSMTTPFPIGTVGLGRSDYTPYYASTVYFGSTGTRSTLTRVGNVITLVLGTPSTTAAIAGGVGTFRWAPENGTTDRAGNAMSTTAVLETGTADRDF